MYIHVYMYIHCIFKASSILTSTSNQSYKCTNNYYRRVLLIHKANPIFQTKTELNAKPVLVSKQMALKFVENEYESFVQYFLIKK